MRHSRAAVIVFFASSILSSVNAFAQQAPITFFEPTTLPEPGHAIAIAVGDMNGDGKPDIVTLDSMAVVVRLNDGHGGFSTPVVTPLPDGYPIYNSPVIALRDFNRDGKLDLAVSGQNGLQIMFGNGDGTVQSPVTVALLDSAGLVAGDFNHDGIPDLVGVPGRGAFAVYLGNGDGTFRQIPNAIDASPSAAADFNGDGKLDLIAGTGTLFGNGDGTFTQGPALPGSFAAAYIAVGDFNRDGRPDLVATTNGQSQTHLVAVYLGNGDGSFQTPSTSPSEALPLVPLVVDLNNDGKPDFITYGNDDYLGVYLGNGDGTFQPPVYWGVGDYTSGVAAGDLLGDRKIELAVSNSDAEADIFIASNVMIVQVGERGRLKAPVNLDAGNLNVVATADFNQDGQEDIVTSSGLLFEGKGKSLFQPALKIAPASSFVVIGDFNGDGLPDVAFGGATLDVLLGNGDGTFRSSDTLPIPRQSTNAMAVGDFNGDGIPDIVVSPLGFFGNSAFLFLFIGNGDGTFQPATLAGVGDYGDVFGSIATGDFRHSGRLDIVVGSNFGSFVFLNNGDGTFAKPTEIVSEGYIVTEVAVADLNGDGNLDIVMTNGDVNVLLGNGDGTFTLSQTVLSTVSGGFCGLAIADLNGDGILDLAASASIDYMGSQLLPGNGDGTFAIEPGILATGYGPDQLTSGHFSGGLHPDLVISNSESGSVWVLANITK